MTSFGEQWDASAQRASERCQMRMFLFVLPGLSAVAGAFAKPILRAVGYDDASDPLAGLGGYPGGSPEIMALPWWVLSLSGGVLAFLMAVILLGSAHRAGERERRQDQRIAKAVAAELRKEG